MHKETFSVLFAMTFSGLLHAQTILTDSAANNQMASDVHNPKLASLIHNAGKRNTSANVVTGTSFLLPGGLILGGSLLFDSRINRDFQEKVVPNDPERKIHVDNFTQYAPVGLTIGLEAAGLKGRHTALQTTALYALSNLILNAVVIPVKHFSHEQRPDQSDYFSFPSGHTTEAFASAELMRLEFADKKPWLPLAGYLFAGTTAYLRIYNNKHWISDVVAGAGIGIASTRLACLLYDTYRSRHARKHLRVM